MKDYRASFLSNSLKLKKITELLNNRGIELFEYYPQKDTIYIYDGANQECREVPRYLEYLKGDSRVHPEDLWKATEFFEGRMRGAVELRVIRKSQKITRKILEGFFFPGSEDEEPVLIGCSSDIIMGRRRVEALEERARRDSLTGLYNHSTGKELVDEYLRHKTPYTSCGLMVIDIDYFKDVNDNFGHYFGDKVLKRLSDFLTEIFDSKDILIRAGGDEFVVFLKEISQTVLVRKTKQFVDEVQRLSFEENGYMMTCSAGICFLPENVSGYSYDQLFENADWALYKAKENGKNGYAFCDSLKRFQLFHEKKEIKYMDVEARYLRNDIISTAFEVFEKTNTFDEAIKILLKVVGIRLQLDRITIIQTDVKNKNVKRQYQWLSENGTSVLEEPGSFTKEDFLTLFHSYDEYGTAVLQHDDMEMYSEGARRLLMQGNAKTVVYAAMYCEGVYKGAISYVVCDTKRRWSKQLLQQFGELTKIISAHLARSQALNGVQHGLLSEPNYDYLTGLLSFDRFRREVEQMILGEGDSHYVIIYSDFEDFKYLNRKHGYSVGDQILQEFTKYVADSLEQKVNVYFTRVVSDQFLLFMDDDRNDEEISSRVKMINQGFERHCAEKYPGVEVRVRSGLYRITEECLGASYAIDAANYARRQVRPPENTPVFYGEETRRRQAFENDIIHGLDEALKNGEFKMYLQPKVSLADYSVTGAEALVRWEKPDGTILYPDTFVPIYEENGRIIDIDFCIFEQLAAFIEKNREALKRKGMVISVNASILHAFDKDTAKHYEEILDAHGVDPDMVEIELTETATVSQYMSVKRLFKDLLDRGMHTALDDFGAGYSVMNSITDIPVDTVKLDRNFLKICQGSKRGIFYLRQLITMIGGLGCHVICEDVETERQAELLRRIGCDEAQGFLFSRAVPVREFEERWINQEESSDEK